MSKFPVSPLPEIHNHHITTTEPWVTRLLQSPDCFMAFILCVYFSSQTTYIFRRLTSLLSSLCRRIWKYWTSKILVRYILLSLCLRLSQFSKLSFMQYRGLWVFSLPIYLLMIARICVLYLIIKSGVWLILLCLGLGHETMVCIVCLSVFSWVQDKHTFVTGGGGSETPMSS